MASPINCLIFSFLPLQCKENKWEYNGTLDFWDMRYYTNMVEEKEYSVDQQALKEYFPLERVTEGLLGIYQQMLSLVFIPVPDAPKWHADVDMVSFAFLFQS